MESLNESNADTNIERLKARQAEAIAALETVETLPELAELVRELDEGDGLFTSNAGGRIEVQKVAQNILAGFGGNIPDSRIQRAAMRIEEAKEESLKTPEDIFNAMEQARTLEELATLVRKLDDGEGYFEGNSKGGKLPVEKVAQNILAGFGGNIADSRIQRAAMRIAGN